MDELQLIAEALSIRDEGQEARSSAADFDAALLFVARREQRAAESFPAALARVVQTDDDAAALIFAADRRRAAEASLGKLAAAAPSPVAEDAERVRKSGSSPRFSKSEYEDAMLSLSKQLARPGESVAVSFARLAADGVFDDLYQAAEAAEAVELDAAMQKAADGPDDRFHRALLQLATLKRRPGETIEKAYSRLILDPTFQAGYAATQGL